MATIREILIRGRFDPSQIQRGVAEGVAQVNRMAQAAADASRTTAVNINAEIGAFERLTRTVANNADAMQALRNRADNLASSLARLGATDQQLNRIGAAVGRAERAIGTAGMTAAISGATQSTNRFYSALNALHGSPMIGIAELARGIGTTARMGEVGALAMREFTGAGFRLAGLLGPAGPLLPIIAILGYSFYEMFHGAQQRAEETRKKFEDEFKKMVDALDQSGLRNKLRDLEIGKPSEGAGKGGGFAGSLRDIVAQRNTIVEQIAEQQATLDAALQARGGHENIFTRAARRNIQALENYWRELGEQLAPLRKTQAEIRKALLEPVIVPGQTTEPGIKPVVVKADTMAAEIEKQAQAATRLAGIYRTLEQRHETSAETSDALLRSYDQLTRTITRLKASGRDMFDPMIESLTKAQDALEASDLIRALRLGKLPAQVTPQFTQPNARVPLATSQLGPDLIGQLLRAIQSRGGITGAAQPAVDAGRLTNFLGPTLAATFREVGSSIKATLTGTLVAAFGPVAILMRALQPAIEALTPLFDRLAVPLAMVARVIVASIEPILRALFPILRAFGIAVAIVGEVMARISAAIAQAVGGLVKAIGNLIAKVPGLGGVGHAIANFGQSMLNFAEGQKKAAAEFARTRKELQGMTWDGTAAALANLQNSANGAADALTNIPNTFKVNRAIFLAAQPVNPQTPSGGQANYFGPGSIVIQGSNKTGAQLLDEVSSAARQKAMARTGTTADAPDMLG